MYDKWLSNDPDPQDRATLEALIADPSPEAQAALKAAFAEEIAFGTAGLRGKMGPGPACMNTAVIRRATWGLSAALREVTGEGFLVVIGFDGRHRSEDFARDTAGVVVATGGKALLMPHECPTPLLAFAMGKLHADAGVMVTASHNPAQDNGYKVYLGGRIVTGAGANAQLVSPWDAKIFSQIQAAPAAKDVPCASEGWDTISESLFSQYIERAASLVKPESPRELRVVLTSMHGVGAEICESSLARAGFIDVLPVAEQREPNPDFPTIPFPNPEEAGALDLAIALAQEKHADLIVANDPDADRCAAAIPDSSSPTGWRQLSGDETGTLLGYYMCQRVKAEGKLSGATVAHSMVSGELLDKVSAAAGVQPMVSLTGFKWISRTPGIVFGYEEAIGNCCDPEYVRDKDGISATVKICEIVAELKASGRSIDDCLDELYLQHGLHLTAPLTFRVADLSLISEGMRRLRSSGLDTLGGEPVTFRHDLSQNQMPDAEHTSVPAGWENLSLLPPTDALFFGTASGTRVVVRPSGTEPKLKCYLQVVIPIVTAENLAENKTLAKTRLKTIKTELSQVLGF
ncbi:phospho-sugar mutase [Mobiluncus mulieris]|uniref:Phospho-sugar mutase n=1 Tax=Mobiluncus mulieris TaxID=2052 RepID=A0A7Y0USE2_9ACTO|nr:phospho-sugar mutase [Mobiluncus mulieris]NMX02872.1 phospho-sugar mutase [Mobiluncus mulieris]NMX11833.1 phospho-sugar mutase [Mobiluncus mulieris]